MFSGAQAKDLGLVDELGDEEHGPPPHGTNWLSWMRTKPSGHTWPREAANLQACSLDDPCSEALQGVKLELMHQWSGSLAVSTMSDSLLQLIGLRGATTCRTTAQRDPGGGRRADRCAGGSQRPAGRSDRVADLFRHRRSERLLPGRCRPTTPGWDGVALLDCQQMAVAGDLERCIRVLAHVWLPEGTAAYITYLEEARPGPDRLWSQLTAGLAGPPRSAPFQAWVWRIGPRH